jgi:type II secretion system protein C
MLTVERAAAGRALAAAYAPQVVAAALAAAIVWQCVVIAVPAVFRPSVHAVNQAIKVPAQAAALSIDSIVRAHLFGQRNAEPVVVAAAAGNLVLVGTLASADPHAGAALIQTPDFRSHLYQTGALVSGGALLVGVYVDHVILSLGDEQELLRFPKAGSAERSQGAAPAMTAEQSGADGSRGEAGGARQLPAAAPVLEVFNAQPKTKAGRFYGVRVAGVHDEAALARMGLSVGDVITHANGQRIASATAARDFLQSLPNAGVTTVTVERGGETRQVTMNSGNGN